MHRLAPLGNVYQASTFSGNPIVMQAGLATLESLAGLKKDYIHLKGLAEHLSQALEQVAGLHGVNLRVSRFGSMFSLKFKEKRDFTKFYRGMLRQGVYFAPSEFESNFLSFAHRKADIDNTIKAATSVLADI